MAPRKVDKGKAPMHESSIEGSDYCPIDYVDARARFESNSSSEGSSSISQI